MSTNRGIASFLIRFTQDLWEDEQGEPRVQWRGRINHVQGDEEQSFTDFSEVVEFIQQHLTQLTLDSIPKDGQMDQEKTLHESFKLWERFASSYTDLMFDAMERTIQGSQVIKNQMDVTMDEMFKRWKASLQPPSEKEVVGKALTKLVEQVQVLADRVAYLEERLEQEKKS
ncbi:MAG: hypothetical protein PVG14_15500 [Anaerolineales bacterium]|jgi:hypothetical protein